MKKNYALLKSFIVLLSLVTVQLNAQLSGVVTINSGAATSGTNYQTFTALASALSSSGISGPLTVNVTAAAGYTEQPLFNVIPGTSATNTITVNGNGAQLTFPGTSSQAWTLGMNGADYMYFNNLNVKNTGTSYAYALDMTNGSDYNHFTACSFSVQQTGTSYYQAPVLMSGNMQYYYQYGNTGNFNVWDGCVANGGMYGFVINGQYNAPYCEGNKILNTTIGDFYQYGIYSAAGYPKNYLIKGNTLQCLNRTSMNSYVYGIQVVYAQGLVIDGNRIQRIYDLTPTNTGYFYGIYSYYNLSGGGKANPNIVKNNVISDIKHNGYDYGMLLEYIDGYIYHNTISFDYTSSTGGSAYGIYVYGQSGYDQEFKNNLITITKGGTGAKYGIYGGNTSNNTFDKDDIYVNSAGGNNYLGYWGGSATSLSALQALGAETNGFNVDPMYTSPASYNYLPTNSAINNQGAAVGVYSDVQNNPRSGSTPDIGAYEFLSQNCVSTPSANAITPSVVTICSGENALLALQNYYSDLGITYQWQTSNNGVSWTNVAGATGFTYNTPNLTATTYFGVIMTCNFGGGSINPTAQVNIAGVTTSVVPCFEGFEGITKPNQLPNCSWSATNKGSISLTYLSSSNQNRSARTGNKFAAFFTQYTSGSNYFYTNGIQLTAGITYSASVWYKTEFYGYTNVTDFSMLYGTSQSTTGLTSIVSSNGPASSGVYTPLSNTFQVASSGVYYVALKSTMNNSYGQYLSFDDFAIEIPCSLNTTSVTVSTSTNTICKGQSVDLTASGADDYVWSTSATGPMTTEFPTQSTNYYVVATNTLSGCSQTINTGYVNVLSSPNVLVIANKPVVCVGQPLILTANGAASYQWSVNNAVTSVITVTPTQNTTYTVVGTNTIGCSTSVEYAVVVAPNPTITVTSDAATPNTICKGEYATLTGVGALSFAWASSSGYIQSNVAMVNPMVSTVYTVTGTAANSCTGKTTYILNVDECTGINKLNTVSGVKLYPNPASTSFVVESNSTAVKTIEVSDLTGRVVLTNTSSADKININISNFANGVYYVKVQSDKSSEVIKIVKH